MRIGTPVPNFSASGPLSVRFGFKGPSSPSFPLLMGSAYVVVPFDRMILGAGVHALSECGAGSRGVCCVVYSTRTIVMLATGVNCDNNVGQSAVSHVAFSVASMATGSMPPSTVDSTPVGGEYAAFHVNGPSTNCGGRPAGGPFCAAIVGASGLNVMTTFKNMASTFTRILRPHNSVN